jgi:glycolate oxidase
LPSSSRRVTGRLQKEVEKLGLFYPPDPASKEFSTLGGNVAECAGGPRCVKYGVTRDYVLGLEVVTPTGEIIHTGGRTMKNVVGYDLTRLFVGSEGTLGIVTRIILRLLPKPEAARPCWWPSRASTARPRRCRPSSAAGSSPPPLSFMDASAIDCVRRGPGSTCRRLPGGTDHRGGWRPSRCSTARSAHPRNHPIPLGVIETEDRRHPEESEAIWKVRRSVSPSLRKLNPDKFNEDIVVPRSTGAGDDPGPGAMPPAMVCRSSTSAMPVTATSMSMSWSISAARA